MCCGGRSTVKTTPLTVYATNHTRGRRPVRPHPPLYMLQITQGEGHNQDHTPSLYMLQFTQGVGAQSRPHPLTVYATNYTRGGAQSRPHLAISCNRWNSSFTDQYFVHKGNLHGVESIAIICNWQLYRGTSLIRGTLGPENCVWTLNTGVQALTYRDYSM